EDGIRDRTVTGVQTCALPISTIESHGATLDAKVTTDDDREQANIIAPHPIAAGAARLHIVFTGVLNHKLRGFYLSETPKRRYARSEERRVGKEGRAGGVRAPE